MRIDDIKAGPFMDALIAEKILGWKQHLMVDSMTTPSIVYCGRCGKTDVGNTFCEPNYEAPAFSTDILKALGVLNLQKYGAYSIFVNGDYVSVEVQDHYADGIDNGIEDIPVIACRALLKAALGYEYI